MFIFVSLWFVHSYIMIASDNIQMLREAWRQAGRTVVLTNGVFDLMHSGHVRYLEQARSLGDVLVVGLNSDASTRANKGPRRPLVPQEERAYMLASLRCVDYVTIFDQPTAEELVARLRPDIYVKGGDYAVPGGSGGNGVQPDRDSLRVDERRLPEARVVRGYGGQVLLLPYHAGLSTSALIERIVSEAGASP